jgi:hypothetical protein
MIQVVPQMRILVAVEAVDFRKGIDGLSRLCDERVQAGSSCPAPGDPTIAILLHHLEASFCRKLAEVVKLGFNVLVGGADADIDGCFQRRLP